MLFFLTAVSSAFAAETIFIEAESAKNETLIIQDHDGAFNGKVLTSTEKEQKATIEFEVKEGGTYAIWARVHHKTQLDNSFFYSMDKEETKWVFDLFEDESQKEHFNNWYWWKLNFRNEGVLFNEKLYELSPGKHTLDLYAREPGALLDKIIITNDLTYDPTEIMGDPEVATQAPAEAQASSGTEAAAQTTTEANPQTGDAGITLYLILAAAGAASFLLLRRKSGARTSS